MLQQKEQLDAYIKITDLVLADGSAGGTEVLLKIPVSYD
jgi:2-phospho-L-lactate guanylyltransferase (CobY/MobA/RfbA family)